VDNFRLVLDEARSAYFIWAAHDDIWESSYLQCLIDLLERHPKAILAFSRFDNIDGLGRIRRTFKEDWRAIFARAKWFQFFSFILADPVKTQKANHIYGIFRTDTLRNRGGLERLADDYAGCDVVTLFDLLITGDFVIHDQVLFHYREGHRYSIEELRNGSAVMRAKKHVKNIRLTCFRHHLMYGAMKTYVPKAPKKLRSFLYSLLALSELMTFVRTFARICAHDLRAISALLVWKVTGTLL
jgi:GT2 family glycosyltransferase